MDTQNCYTEGPFSRLELLVGREGLSALGGARVLVCGLGGVGSWAAEMLVRSGVGGLGLLDFDVVKESNLNRQLPALISTVGRKKAEVLAERFRDINPQCQVEVLDLRLNADNVRQVLESRPWDYVLDAIDDRPAKLALLQNCLELSMRVVSSLGAASKLDPGLVCVADISETYGCPLAKYMRKALKRAGITEGITVVYSPELPILPAEHPAPEEEGSKAPLGTIAYLPALFGLRCAAEIIGKLLPAKGIVRRGDTPPKTE